MPKWSPDGRVILSVAYRVEDGNPTVVLYTIGADGSNCQKVDIPLRNFAPITSAWMPDGEHIIFVAKIYRQLLDFPPDSGRIAPLMVIQTLSAHHHAHVHHHPAG